MTRWQPWKCCPSRIDPLDGSGGLGPHALAEEGSDRGVCMPVAPIAKAASAHDTGEAPACEATVPLHTDVPNAVVRPPGYAAWAPFSCSCNRRLGLDPPGSPRGLIGPRCMIVGCTKDRNASDCAACSSCFEFMHMRLAAHNRVDGVDERRLERRAEGGSSSAGPCRHHAAIRTRPKSVRRDEPVDGPSAVEFAPPATNLACGWR